MTPRPRRSRARSGRPQDEFGERAKREGFPARSVYKLEEIDRRIKLLRRGQRVLDLGAFPGSWTLYAAGKVGREGRVLGIDLQEHTAALPPNARMLTADVSTVTPAELGTFDVVLSDMAPSTIGARDADQWKSYLLFIRALEIAVQVLAPGGSFVGKIFQGADFLEAKRAVQRSFAHVRIIKPEASRKESYEIFLIGLEFRGQLPKPPNSEPA